MKLDVGSYGPLTSESGPSKKSQTVGQVEIKSETEIKTVNPLFQNSRCFFELDNVIKEEILHN